MEKSNGNSNGTGNQIVRSREDADKLLHASEQVMGLSRDTICANRCFLSRAANNLDFKALEFGDKSRIMTDGKYIYYDPVYIAKNYASPEFDGIKLSVRNYLHMMFHCICKHMFVGVVDPELWDLAADIAAESMINDLKLDCAKTPKEQYQRTVEMELKRHVPALTAERIYKLLRSGKISAATMEQWKLYYEADTHDLWYMSDAEMQARYGIGDFGTQSTTTTSGATVSKGGAEHWEDIATQLNNEMKEFYNSGMGYAAGTLTLNIDEMKRERYDYTSFLEKFAVLGEEMQLNYDEFDYIPYSYGLQEYGNVLFIEPLEYKDVKRIKEFVIAIDTSGSVRGKLVQSFMRKTYNILKSTESFFQQINLHIIQCDTVIQSSVKITNAEQFEEYIKNVKLNGFGGTDFRPVFKYVDDMKANGEFSNLKGLIYFTDGYGIFPSVAPDYEAAFVFLDYGLSENFRTPEVPSWAIKLVLEEEDINNIKD